MTDRRRIETPPVDVEAITNRIDDARQIIPLENKVEALKELYDVETDDEVNLCLMEDIVLAKMTDVRSLPTAKTTKTAIYNDYCMITGKSRRSAERYFKKVQKRIKNIHNIGMVVHYAAAVGQDVVSRILKDLEKLEGQEDKIIKDLKDYDSNTVEGSKKIYQLEGRLNRIIGQKDKKYEQLMNYAKTFGTDLSIKATQNTINEQKNEILAQKFDNDAAWQKADVFIRHKDMTPDQKRKALSQAISSDKGISELVESSFEAKVIEDESE